MELTERFWKHCNNEKLMQKGDRVLVALSGGKDSVCLFFLLLEHQKKLGITLGACHVHHGIREDAEHDLLFCKTLCRTHKIPFFERRLDTPSFCQKEKLGLEEGARILRYRALRAVARENGYTKIATAHSRSDQAETLLFRLIRGTGSPGLCGIRSIDQDLIRPLLPFSSREIRSFLEKSGKNFTEDSTNDDIYYARNRIRRKILPEMEEINPSVEEALVRFGTVIACQNELIEHLCNDLETKYQTKFSDCSFPLLPLRKLAQTKAYYPILYCGMRRMAETQKISISFERFTALISLLNRSVSGKIIEISQGYSFRIEKNKLLFGKNEPKEPCIRYQIELHEGSNPIPLFDQKLHVSPKNPGKVVNINKKLLIIHAASDKMVGKLFVRNFMPGDRIRMNGMNKSVKKILCDAGIPKEDRKKIPLVCDEKGILWIPFLGLTDRARDPDATEFVTFSLSGQDLTRIEKIIERNVSNND